MTDATDELVAEIKAGLEGVTPGPWAVIPPEREDQNECDLGGIVNANGGRICEFGDSTIYYNSCGEPPSAKDAAHIARCSPDNIAALLSRLEAETARAEEWKAAYGQACDDYAAIVKQTIEQKAENARLAAELAEARKIVGPFAGVAARAESANAHFGGVHTNDVPDSQSYGALGITWGHLRAARAWHERNG